MGTLEFDMKGDCLHIDSSIFDTYRESRIHSRYIHGKRFEVEIIELDLINKIRYKKKIANLD